MHYIVFDLEWNQPPDENAIVTDPVRLEGEIIEIGAVKLDENFTPIDELRLYVTPKYYTKMHKRIAALTGIHDKDLAERGIPFPEAYQKFSDWCGDEYTYMTWSLSDLPVLLDNMYLHGFDIYNIPPCCDIQRIFSREILNSSTRCSLDHALELLSITGDTAHDALHDARNTAKVCDRLDLREYLHEYTFQPFGQPPDPTVYETAKDALDAPALLTFPCPWCGQSVKCEPWISCGNNNFMTYGLCPEEDEFILRMVLQRHNRDRFQVRRMIMELSDDLWDIYMDRKEALAVPQP